MSRWTNFSHLTTCWTEMLSDYLIEALTVAFREKTYPCVGEKAALYTYSVVKQPWFSMMAISGPDLLSLG